ncbi:MAG: galactose oxidase early set domain-containing protein [Planctomycetes bacterium]|nr:galactose oxidase early set domain-containing protein [Planctomycetota bacterium]
MIDPVPPGGISSFELIRPDSVTHSTHFDQRWVKLPFTAGGTPGQFLVTVPSGPQYAPRGWYMLFAVSGQGAPSVAQFVQVK